MTFLRQSFIEKRLNKRIAVGLDAGLLLNGRNFTGYVRNLSVSGLSMFITPVGTAPDSAAAIHTELELRLPDGETLNLYCEKRWAYPVSRYGVTEKIGMEIIDPPVKFKEFLNTLKGRIQSV